MKLYEKVMVGRRTTYKEHVPAAPDGADDMNDKQLVTLAVSIGVTCLLMIEKNLPEHSRNHRAIKHVEQAILKLAQGQGAEVDREIVDYWINVWNETMTNIQRGLMGGAS